MNFYALGWGEIILSFPQDVILHYFCQLALVTTFILGCYFNNIQKWLFYVK